MFEVSFSELIVIGVVALIVIGPEKLPKVARTVGLLVGRLQRYMADVKADIERQIQYEDLQKLQQEIRQGAQSIQSELNKVSNEANNTIQLSGQKIDELKAEVQSINNNVEKS